MKTLGLGWLAAAVLCATLLASCASGSPEAVQAPLGWGGPIEAGELRRWSEESLEEAARWSVAEAPSFVMIPDSFRSWDGHLRQRRVAGGTVFPDGRVILLYMAEEDSNRILLHILDPASGEEAKIPRPKLMGEDGRPLRPAAFSLAGDTIWIVPTERPELLAVDRSGDVLLKVAWEAGDRTIPEEVVLVERVVEVEVGDSPREAMAITWGLVEEGVVRPRTERFPATNRLLIGTNGLIHVQRMVWDDDRPRAGPEWLVFNQAGELAARLDIPRNLDVLAFGPAFVVAQGKNEAGAMEVRVYGLKRP